MEKSIEPLGDTEFDAICSRIDRVTVRLIDSNDEAGGGSAVSLKIGPNIVLLTAAHVVNNGHSFVIARKEGIPIEGLRLVAVDEAHDTAVMKLPSAEHSRLASVAKLDYLVGRFSQREVQPVIVTGFPGSDHVRFQGKTYYVARACQTETVLPSEWPENLHSLDDPPQSGRRRHSEVPPLRVGARSGRFIPPVVRKASYSSTTAPRDERRGHLGHLLRRDDRGCLDSITASCGTATEFPRKPPFAPWFPDRACPEATGKTLSGSQGWNSESDGPSTVNQSHIAVPT